MPKKRKRKPPVAGRLGPPTNLRPAGAHDDKRRKTREELLRDALKDEAL